MKKPKKHNSEPFMYKDFEYALKKLSASLRRGNSYALLLGESGTGKTTLLRTLQDKLDKTRFNVLYLCHGQPSPSGLARVLAEAVHLPIRRTRAETSRMLVQTLKNMPTRLLFWIDEAQLIRDDTLHEIRLLSEADLQGPPLFSVILSALPALKDRLLAPDLFPLYRRINIKAKLRGLVREEAEAFLTHRLLKEQCSRFSRQAIDILFEQARGVPAIVESMAADCISAYPKNNISAKSVEEILENRETQ